MSLTVREMYGCVVMAMTLLVIPAGASAQAPGRFLISGGGGYGSADARCDDCVGDRQGGAAGYFRLGYAVTPRLVLGGEANVWTKRESLGGASTRLRFSSVSATAAFYPDSAGFFIRGGAGLAMARLDVNARDSSLREDLGSGFGVLAGLGYDIPISRRLSMTPGVNVSRGQIGDLKALGQTFATGWSQNVIDVTIGLTFR
ncbi:MAG: hypothetical protein ABS36_16450 [Acidobacteria bacterium SCN 69-37]|nr:MAG: hypothetical protein ABS36_16450 [Acidobacteria bacterium SCN 69-37]